MVVPFEQDIPSATKVIITESIKLNLRLHLIQYFSGINQIFGNSSLLLSTKLISLALKTPGNAL